MAVITTDYLIVGAGTAGSVLAARLSEDPAVRVTLLEAGSDSQGGGAADPHAWRSLAQTELDWGFVTTAQSGAGERAIAYPRGKAVGGTSVINAMMHVWPQRSDFVSWPSDATTSWTFDELLPFLRKAEAVAPDTTEATHGTTGPFRVRAEPENEFTDAAISAFGTLRHAWVGRFPLAIRDGARMTVADAYLTRDVRSRRNLSIVPDATVTRLRFDDDRRCVGAEFSRDGATESVVAHREVILCAGVIGTPQLLQVSGIGAAEALTALGVPVVVDRPEVGRNLRDHPLVIMAYPSGRPVPSEDQRVEAGALVYSDATQTTPDLHLFVMRNDTPDGGSAVAVGVAVLRPESAGSVAIASADIAVPPLVDPDLLGAPEDLRRLQAGVGLVRELVRSGRLQPFTKFEVLPGAGTDTEEALARRLRELTGFYWHGVGTARMGADQDAVLDPELRVNGVHALRVVDASVMPDMVSANTNATVLAIAERAAHIISHDAEGTPSAAAVS